MTETTTTAAGKWMPEEYTREMYTAFWDAEAGQGCIRFADAYRAMLRAAPPPAPAAPSAAQWMPIETAPKDGTRIDVWLSDDEFPMRRTDVYWGRPHHECGEAGSYCDSCPPDRDMWCDDLSYGEPEDLNPTHWMPIAAAPGAQPAQGGSVSEAAKRIAWAFWNATPGRKLFKDADRLWAGFTSDERTGWLSAARASAPAAPEVVEAGFQKAFGLAMKSLRQIGEGRVKDGIAAAELAVSIIEQEYPEEVAALRAAGEG